MKSPFTHTVKAFEVFFDNRIVCIMRKGETEKKLSLDCSVMEDLTADSIMDESIDSDGRQFNIVVGDCKSIDLMRGDKLVTCDNKKYAVMSVVDDSIFGKVIKARLAK